MERKRRLLFNTGLLTGSALIARVVGMAFQAWLASRIGASGIGLYQLIGSVTVLFSAVAISGIRFAAARLVSEEAGLQRGSGVTGAMLRCLCYAVIFGTAAGSVLYSLSQPIAFLWVGDARAVQALRVASFGLPVLSLSAVFGGYFTASGRAWKAALIQVLEQAAAVICVIFLLRRCVEGDLEAICSAVVSGNVLAGLAALLFMIAMYAAERKRWRFAGDIPPKLTNRMLAIALPLAVSSYTRTALSTLEHLLIPRMLRRFGLGAEAALSGYGVIHGMALTAVLFPACLLFAFSEVLVPELTNAQMQGRHNGIRHMVKKARSSTLLYAMLTSIALLLLSNQIAIHVFHTPEASSAIRLLAPLVPIMNLDTVTDACLRGIGRQGLVMLINILDALLGVTLVLILLPRYGIHGYVMMIWATESINCALSTIALKHAMPRC